MPVPPARHERGSVVKPVPPARRRAHLCGPLTPPSPGARKETAIFVIQRAFTFEACVTCEQGSAFSAPPGAPGPAFGQGLGARARASGAGARGPRAGPRGPGRRPRVRGPGPRGRRRPQAAGARTQGPTQALGTRGPGRGRRPISQIGYARTVKDAMSASTRGTGVLSRESRWSTP